MTTRCLVFRGLHIALPPAAVGDESGLGQGRSGQPEMRVPHNEALNLSRRFAPRRLTPVR
jgi:hypothetical protein